MKRLFTLIAALLFAATVWAQSSSPKMSYQAVVRNAANELVVNRTDLTVEISIKQADTVAYKETHSNVKTNQNGLVSLLIGTGTVNKGSLNAVDWTKAEISTSINLGGETVSATAPVTAVPYALYAESVNPNSEVISGIQGDITDIQSDITEIQENYLTKAGLCDSIMSCPTITEIQGDITTIQSNVTNLTDNYLTKAGLCDSIKNCPTITEIQSNISEIKGDIDNLTDNYLTKAGLCDSIKNCPTITEIQSNISEIEGNITNITDDYLTKAGLCDSIKSCPTIKDMDNSISENKAAIEAIDGRIRTDSLEIVELYASTMESVLGKIKTDSSALAGQISTNANQIATNTGEIASIKDDYLTKAGLCDSIKSCDAIKGLNDTLDFYYTKEEINDTLSKYLTKKQINTKLKNYLTIDGLCDSIKNNCTDVALTSKANTFEKKNTFNKKVILNKSAVQADGSIDTGDSLVAVNAKDLINYTGKAIHDSITNNVSTMLSDSLENYLTIDGLCDSIKNKCGDFATKKYVDDAIDGLDIPDVTGMLTCGNVETECGKIAIRTAANTFTGKNTFSDTIDAKAGAVLVTSVVTNVGTIGTNDSLRAVNATDLVNYTGKAIHDSITNNVSTMLSDSLENYLIIDGLCDSIKNKCTDIATITTVQTAIHDSIVNNISKQISDSLKNLDIPDVSGMLTCDNVDTKCGKIAIKTAENIFTAKNTFSDTIDATDAASAIIVNSVVTNGAIAATDSSRAVNAKDLASYVDNAVAAKQVTLTIPSITVEDSTKLMNDTTLTIPAGFDTLDLSHLVQFYINGVYVGDTDDQVLTVNATTKKVHYDPAKNGGYALKVGDRIKIIYWVKKN